MAELVLLHPDRASAAPEPPPEDVLSLLRNVLARAECGEVQGLGMFWVQPNRDVLHAYASGSATVNTMVVGAVYLQHSLLSQVPPNDDV